MHIAKDGPGLRGRLAFAYLCAVPFLSAVVAFANGHIPVSVYLPIWLIHVCIMLSCAWVAGIRDIRKGPLDKKPGLLAAIFLIVPWIFISIFFGMGPPPSTAAEWVSTETEQQVRYVILIVGGILSCIGFALLREKLKDMAGSSLALIGLMAFAIAIPLFVLNMAYWGGFLSQAFRQFQDIPGTIRPDWYLPVRAQFNMISMAEVALLYAGTIAMAGALRQARVLKRAPLNLYMIFSLFGLLCSLLPQDLPAPFSVMAYLASIPAIPFIMPYLIGVNLARGFSIQSV